MIACSQVPLCYSLLPISLFGHGLGQVASDCRRANCTDDIPITVVPLGGETRNEPWIGKGGEAAFGAGKPPFIGTMPVKLLHGAHESRAVTMKLITYEDRQLSSDREQ